MDFGMSSAVSRFVSNFRACNNQKGIDAFLGLAIKFFALICTIVAVILTIVYFNIQSIYSNLTATELSSFKVVFIITSIFVVTCFPVNICNGILNAYEEYIWLKGIDIINRVGTVITTIIALTLGGGIFALISINGMFNILSFGIKIVICKTKTPIHVTFAKDKSISLKDIFSFSIWTTIGSVAQQMIFNIIPSMLAMVANTMAITLYGFANVIEGYVFTITQAINGLFMPRVSRDIVADKDAKKVLPLMIKVGRINQSIITLLLIGITVLGQEFVHLWVGDEYSSLYFCILFLAFPYYISASQQIANTSITVLNKVKYYALINLATGLLNLVGSYFVCRAWGVVGVCAFTGLSFMLRIILLNIVYKSVLHIDIWEFFKECQVKMFPPTLIILCLSWLAAHFLSFSAEGMLGWIYFGIKVFVVCIIYIAVMWSVGWNSEEKQLLKSFVKKGA
jgi:O-antigen/teichoic acid export membrane protein